MSAIPSTAFPSDCSPALNAGTFSVPSQLLREVPKLLEYRAEADPDAEFIPKTIAGFAIGFMVMSACLAFLLVLTHALPSSMMLTLLAFMLGIAGVASSLLLVGLKVRADHCTEYLYARHWLNSLSTGAGYAMLICGPWILIQHGFSINRFIAAALWMLLMAFPAAAAKWTVQPHPHLGA